MRLTLDASDGAAARTLAQLSRTVPPATAGGARGSLETAAASSASDSAVNAAALYATHCSTCHGPRGDGRGRAARHLFPRPRNLRTDRYRLVSTRNGVPTQHDVEAVLRRGMPGASMPEFPQLNDTQRTASAH